MKLKSLTILLMLSLSSTTYAQFYVSPGSIFYTSATTPLLLDGLVLTPTAPLTLNGVSVNKSSTPIAGSGGNSVSKVYYLSGNITITGMVGIYVDNAELNGNTLSDLQIAYDAGSGFITTNTSTVDNLTNFVSNQFASPVTLSKLTAVGSATTLPIELVAFNATTQNNKIKLQWTTAFENQVDYFMVEKSADGKFFTNLLTQKAKGGITQAEYIDYDHKPEIGLNYYRLVDVDKQGNKSYSAIKVVRYNGVGVQFSLLLYPNPATDVVFAELSGNVPLHASLTLTDVSGKVLMKIPVNERKVGFNITNLPAGMYFANYADGQNNFSVKLIKK